MELKQFIEEALKDIVGGVEDAQKGILHGEIVPHKDGKIGEADIEFEIAVKPEDNKLLVVVPPAPPAPNLSKLKFKIPVRLPKRRRNGVCHFVEYYFIQWREAKENKARLALSHDAPAALSEKEEVKPVTEAPNSGADHASPTSSSCESSATHPK